MSAIGQSSICSSIDCTYTFFGHKETQIIDIRWGSFLNSSDTLSHIRTLRFYITNLQATMICMTEDLSTMRLNSPSHKECHWMSTLLHACNNLDRHNPTFVRIKTADLKEK